MIKASNKFIQAIDNGKVDYLINLGITFADGTHTDLTQADIWSNGIKLEDATSSDSGFTIGAFVSTKLTLILNNIDDKFSYYNFDNAHIDTLEIGFKYDDDSTEMLSLGEFWVDDPGYNTSLITLKCTDRGREFNKDSYFSGLTFPCSLGDMMKYVVAKACGTSDYLATPEFANYDYVINSAPTTENHTWADFVAYISQIAGCYAKFHTDGKLYLEWYGGEVYSTDIDGGEFDHPTESGSPYETGNDVDGGDFSYNDTGKNYDGGFFTDMGTYHLIKNVKSIQVNTDAFTITKITVKECFTETDSLKEDIQSFSKYSGTSASAYEVQIQNNPLIQAGQAAAVARLIGDRVIGLTFRPLSVTAIAYPLIEAGDIAYVIDRKGVTYHTFVSSRSYTIGNGVTISCAGKSAAENMQKSYSDTEKQIAGVDEKLDDTQDELAEEKNKTSVRFDVLDDRIESEVTAQNEKNEQLSSRITQTAEEISAEVTRAKESERTLSSRISQKADSISLSVNNDSGPNASITISLLDENGNVIDSGEGIITLQGKVVFASQLTDGTTTISGDNIKTGKISADRIDVNGLTAGKIYTKASYYGNWHAGFAVGDNGVVTSGDGASVVFGSGVVMTGNEQVNGTLHTSRAYMYGQTFISNAVHSESGSQPYCHSTNAHDISFGWVGDRELHAYVDGHDVGKIAP